MPVAYFSAVGWTTAARSYEKPGRGTAKLPQWHVRNRTERGAQSDVGPMSAAPFAVFTAGNSQDQRPLLLLSGGWCGGKGRISASLAALLAVLSLYLTAVSANTR